MKIRPSLKIHFFAVTLLLVMLITTAFSALSLNYFFRGLNAGSAAIMEKIAEVDGVADGSPIQMLDFHIASRWEDLPFSIRTMFDDIPITDKKRISARTKGDKLFYPPDEVYLVAKLYNRSGEARYLATQHLVPINMNNEDQPVPHVLVVILLASGSLILFLGGLVYLLRKVAKPIESLKNWAKELDKSSISLPPPDFQYSELNTLATMIKNGIASTQEALDREQKFLAHASHELRTPISVIRVNTELLSKLQTKHDSNQKHKEVLQRIDRAGKTMTNLTDTLLWLHRDNRQLPAIESVDLHTLVSELVAELAYLLDNKPVELNIETSPFTLDIAATPCRIVLANLIRNAFQHTLQGSVTVRQEKEKVTVINTNNSVHTEESDLGFGLGLRLTKELAERYQWHYLSHYDQTNYDASINFRALNTNEDITAS